MQVRNAIVAVTVAAFALTLTACSNDPTPTTTSGTQNNPAATASGNPDVVSSDSPVAPSKIRPVREGFSLATVSNALRVGFPSFADKSDQEIEQMLNAACDAMDAENKPQAGADAIRTYGIAVYDAAFSVTAAIQLYCPEYSAFLKGNG